MQKYNENQHTPSSRVAWLEFFCIISIKDFTHVDTIEPPYISVMSSSEDKSLVGVGLTLVGIFEFVPELALGSTWMRIQLTPEYVCSSFVFVFPSCFKPKIT